MARGHAVEEPVAATEADLGRVHTAAHIAAMRATAGRAVLLEVNERAYFEDGKIAGVVGVARDVTERRKAEDALQFQKTLLESQSEAAIDGILVVSMEGRMISFNRRFLEMWDIPREIAETRNDAAALKSVIGALADPERFLSRVRYLYEHPEEESRDEVILKDGRVFEERQPHIRGGAQEPLTRDDIERKFLGNCQFGGWSAERAQRFLNAVPKFFRAPLDLTLLRG